MTSAGATEQVPDNELLVVLQRADDPVLTTKEAANRVSIGDEAVRRRLTQLHEEGEVHRKTAGRNPVWWVDDPDLRVGADDRFEELDRRLTALEQEVAEQNESKLPWRKT